MLSTNQNNSRNSYVIYGGGARCQSVLDKLANTDPTVKVLRIVDKNYAKINSEFLFKGEKILVCSSETLKENDYDYIVISSDVYRESILVDLGKLGVDYGKITVLKDVQNPLVSNDFYQVSNVEDGYFIDFRDYHLFCKTGDRSTSVIFQEVFINHEYNISFGDLPTVVIDIGANVGFASLFFAGYKNVERIYSFELMPPTYECALFNMKNNPEYSKKVQLFNYGLGDMNREIYLNDATSSGGISAFHIKGNIKCIIKRASEILQPIFDENKDKKILMKVDTEGSEFEILKDLDESGLIKQCDAIIGEWHTHDWMKHGSDNHIGKIEELESHFANNGFTYYFSTQIPILGNFIAVKTN
jgi:FkbM family methyltransferase